MTLLPALKALVELVSVLFVRDKRFADVSTKANESPFELVADPNFAVPTDSVAMPKVKSPAPTTPVTTHFPVLGMAFVERTGPSPPLIFRLPSDNVTALLAKFLIGFHVT